MGLAKKLAKCSSQVTPGMWATHSHMPPLQPAKHRQYVPLVTLLTCRDGLGACLRHGYGATGGNLLLPIASHPCASHASAAHLADAMAAAAARAVGQGVEEGAIVVVALHKLQPADLEEPRSNTARRVH